MTVADALGVSGVVLMLGSFAGVQLRRLDPHAAPSLLMNLIGAILVLYSLSFAFNLPAVLMESAWAVVALYGLVRLVLKR